MSLNPTFNPADIDTAVKAAEAPAVRSQPKKGPQDISPENIYDMRWKLLDTASKVGYVAEFGVMNAPSNISTKLLQAESAIREAVGLLYEAASKLENHRADQAAV